VPSWKRVAFGALAAAACLLALIAANIATGDPLAILDARIAAWMHAHRSAALTLLMLGITHAHAPVALCVYAITLALVLSRRRERHWLAGLALAVPVGLLINVLLKHVFQRARPVPDEPLLTLTTYSFPSGHTAGSTLFYGLLAAYIVSRTRSPSLRAAAIASWIFLVSLVAFSRVYLEVHYFSDVLAAMAWSLGWLALCLAVVHALRGHSASARDGL
jgi:membrane-associated phospholipid phosphatase